MKPSYAPYIYLAHVMQVAAMAAEAQAVIAMRMMGMAGIWSVPPSEKSRMISEKVKAMQKSNAAAVAAALKGGTPDKVFAAALKPYRSRTRANTRRLSKRGVKRR